ncbi:MAG: ABC transporter permease [Gemmatimonadetes bacterium]|nr:ABC transporter permease [Gemmatimonadota bacterium]MCB9505232.1 ABC transporter permease [Gemmatimonadales bacterium]MCB9518297.1 ABC transporter permease [Gemmatimonadales bacterium]HPF62162.1 ABC transporter permease [Gemmatimonadales bacterium]
MPLFEAVRLALSSIRAQKLKSFFSLVGVMIGVTFLIAVVSVVQGMNVYMTDKFAGSLIGVNTFQLRSRPNIVTGDVDGEQWREWNRRPRITTDDAEFIRERLTVPARMARAGFDQLTVRWEGREAAQIQVNTVDADYFAIKHWDIAEGRAFSQQEVQVSADVVVLGWELARRLFDGRDPLGQTVTLGGLPHRVIGVVAEQGNLFGISLDKFAVVPLTSPVRRLVNRPRVIDDFHIQTDNVAQMRLAMDEVTALMRARRGLRPSEENNFHLETAEGALEGWQKISAILFMALPGLVAISLVVGGIVIMNIMLMAVAERTREIGVRKALGAKRKDIMAQFIVESATLSATGALFGIASGLLLAFAVRAFTPLPAAVAPWSIGVGVGLGVLVGMVAGILPARQASRLDPIAAMRQE